MDFDFTAPPASKLPSFLSHHSKARISEEVPGQKLRLTAYLKTQQLPVTFRERRNDEKFDREWLDVFKEVKRTIGDEEETLKLNREELGAGERDELVAVIKWVRFAAKLRGCTLGSALLTYVSDMCRSSRITR